MENTLKVLGKFAEMSILPKKYKKELERSLFQEEGYLRVYGMMIATALLDKLADTDIDMVLVWSYLHYSQDQGRFREMHLFLAMCYMGVGLKVPPCFLELGQQEEQLKPLMDEFIRAFDDALVDCGEDDDDID